MVRDLNRYIEFNEMKMFNRKTGAKKLEGMIVQILP